MPLSIILSNNLIKKNTDLLFIYNFSPIFAANKYALYMNTALPFYNIFAQLNHTPRPSHHEEQVADFLCQFAQENGLSYDRDAHNCVVIRKPASPGCEQALPIVILNHMDMVCVAEEGHSFDPLHDTIDAYEENGWMKARHTSLGADNGMGLSMALAILADKNLVHGPLEVITTTNEEDGMDGAANLSPDFIRGRHIINLDSEAYDQITVGAAGAFIQQARLPYHEIRKPKDYICYKVRVKGGLGGHSGVDIVKQRANAIKVLANILQVSIVHQHVALYLVRFDGGQASASIPSSAEAVVAIPAQMEQDFCDILIQGSCALQAQYGVTDPDVELLYEPMIWNGNVIDEESTRCLLADLNAIPTGPLEMHPDMPGTPMTSNNIGTVRTLHSTTTPNTKLSTLNSFEITTHSRSFLKADMELLAAKIRQIFEISGAEVTEIMNAPAWQEDTHSPFLQLTSDVFQDVLGFRPKPVAMHFVLEAGYFVQKYPGIQMASIGPRILEPHSTSERVELETCDNIWHVTLELLRRLSTIHSQL